MSLGSASGSTTWTDPSVSTRVESAPPVSSPSAGARVILCVTESSAPTRGSPSRWPRLPHEPRRRDERPAPDVHLWQRRPGTPATYQLRGRQPRGWATRLSPPAANRSFPLGGQNMLRLQQPLIDSYTAASPDDLAARIGAAKAALGSRLFILGHHYQRDEVMRWADARGDSFGLSRLAAANDQATFVVFCGVHFMAESADILTADHQQVILPDLNAGCSMADMADPD